jgi:D-cysteine desulfhydrase
VVAAQLGMSCHLILRGAKPQVLDGNTLISELSGAQISYYSSKEYLVRSDEIVQFWRDHYAEQGLKIFWIPTGASDEIGLWGYYSAAQELYDDFKRLNIDVGAVCCATGSGGTHAGLALGFQHLKLDGSNVNAKVQAYAVCDNEAYFKEKAKKDIHAWYQRYHPSESWEYPDLHINDAFIGEGYAIANESVFKTIKRLARLEGVILDPVYTGKAFQGLLSDIEAGVYSECENVVFVHTGGVFGLFPYRESLF